MVPQSPAVARPRTAPATVPAWRTVALVGIDGSGKTTQARRLAAELATAGWAVGYWRNAGGRRWLGRRAEALGRPDAQSLVGRRGLLLVEAVLRWLAIARALVGSALRRQSAVMDRHAVCQYASIRAHAPRSRPVAARSVGEWLTRFAYACFPRPDVTFLLVVDPAEAYRRIEARGTDHETPEYLAAADAAYRSLPEFGTFVIIDANLAPDGVARQLHAHLGLIPDQPGILPETPSSDRYIEV